LIAACATGFEELATGLRYWRVWHLLGVRELRNRYARSKLGQVWLTVSTAIMIAALGGVWSLLWQQPIRELMPYIGIGLIIWAFLSQVLIECTSIFTNHAGLYRNQKMVFSISIYAVIYKHVLIFAHALVVIVVLMVAFSVPVNWYTLQIIPGFAITSLSMLWVGYVIAMICVRYRDVIQIVNAWLMVLFFVTPVMWRPNFLPEKYHLIVDLNPLAQFLAVMREPLLGQPVALRTWITVAAIAIGGGVVALFLIGRYHRRIIFWI
jgi:lipopolysaccharide transport system permease protein